MGAVKDLGSVLIGDTRRFTWSCSGTVLAAGPRFRVLDAAGVMVSSVTAASSGNGLYYAHALVSTPGNYAVEWIGVHSTGTFVNTLLRAGRFLAHGYEVD